MSDLKAGDRVLYSPHLDHCLETDHRGAPLFHFHHAEGPKKGERVLPGELTALAKAGDVLRLASGQGPAVQPATCARFWDAVVVQVNADGSADLDVTHPFGQRQPGQMGGCITLHLPDRGAHPHAPGVPRDAGKGPHSFHLPGE